MPDMKCMEHFILNDVPHLPPGKGGRRAGRRGADLKKCFDCVYLSDMYWFLVKNDANMKAVKMFQLLTGTNQLRIHSSDLG